MLRSLGDEQGRREDGRGKLRAEGRVDRRVLVRVDQRDVGARLAELLDDAEATLGAYVVSNFYSNFWLNFGKL